MSVLQYETVSFQKAKTVCVCMCVEVSLLFLATTQMTRYHRQHSYVNELMKERMNGIIYLI